MKIVFIKETKDIREGRSKMIPKGREISMTDDLANEYIKMKVAIKKGNVKPPVIRSEKDLETELEKQN